jgi:NAD(P)-dependent dehydrogenase (short-subunit alcohol dehydrogenase family)
LTGIGRATVIAFAEEGARVAVSGRHSDKGEALVVELKEKGASGALFIKADVRNEAEVAAMVDAVVEKFGSLDAYSTQREQPFQGKVNRDSRAK